MYKVLSPGVIIRFVGGDGCVTGVAFPMRGSDDPAELFATTEIVYSAPFVKPVAVYGPATLLMISDAPIVDRVTVYPVTGPAGAVHDKTIDESAGTAVKLVGASGTEGIIIGCVMAGKESSPKLLVATIVNLYVNPPSRPVTVADRLVVIT
jgi:hypothetical protein